MAVKYRSVTSKPIPVAARSKAWVYGRSLARIVGSNIPGGMDVCVVLYKDSSMVHKWHEGRDDQKKNPTGGMDVCLLWVLCVVR
jgi:hypothetical protein